MALFDGEWTTCTALIGGTPTPLTVRADELRAVLNGDPDDVTALNGDGGTTYTLRWDPQDGYVEA